MTRFDTKQPVGSLNPAKTGAKMPSRDKAKRLPV
jgi:hypothetical protein